MPPLAGINRSTSTGHVDDLTIIGIVVLSLASLAGAVVSATLGNAGGALLLGVMLLSGIPAVMALPLHAVTQLVSNATRMVAFLRHVKWPYAGVFMLAALPGPLIGLWLANMLPRDSVKLMLGVLVIYACWAPKGGLTQLPWHVAMGCAGFLAGVLGVVVGAIGPITALFIFREELPKERVVATAAVCMGFVHILKLIAFGEARGFNALDHLPLLVPMCIAAVIGTFIGRWTHSRLSDKQFRMFFRVSLTLLGSKLCWDGIVGLLAAAPAAA
ncbi:MAG: sulfite exporter TauE/SafE family protein [Planctomycetota bacterium]